MFSLFFLFSLFSPNILALDIIDNIKLSGYATYTKSYGINNEFNFNEILDFGINLNYRINNNIYISLQPVSRSNKIQLDYGLISILINNNIDLMLGRIKIPYGFYNETRDVPFTRPSVLLPQSIYPNKLRDFALSSDGIMLKYSNVINNYYNLGINIGVGYPLISDGYKINFFPMNINEIKLESKLSKVLIINLDSIDLTKSLKYSYINSESKSENNYTGLSFNTHVLSGQYNFNDFRLTSEYSSSTADIKNGINSASQGLYFQIEYFLNSKFTLLSRYDIQRVQFDNDYIKDNNYHGWAFNVKYKLIDNLNLNLFYQSSLGTNPLIPVDITTGNFFNHSNKWDLFMFSLDYKF